MVLTLALVGLVFLMVACEKPESPLQKAVRVASLIRFQFEDEFDEAILPLREKPEIGRTGELANPARLEFLLLHFPEEELPKVEALVRPILEKHGVEAAVFTTFRYGKTGLAGEVVTGTIRLEVSRDGRTQRSVQEPAGGGMRPTLRGKNVLE